MTDLQETFRQAKLKVERAECHVQEYTDSIRAFLKTDFCKVTIEVDGDTGNHRIQIDTRTLYPRHLPTIIGDAVHNMKAAIDYIVVAFVGVKPDYIRLPTAKCREQVESLELFKTIRHYQPKFADWLLDEIQPYAGGKFKIWELSQLDNADKHRLLVPITKFSTLLRLDIEDECGNRIGDSFWSIPEGKIGTLVEHPGKIKINHKGYAGINILFGDDTPFPGEPVFDILANLPKPRLRRSKRLSCSASGRSPNQTPANDGSAIIFDVACAMRKISARIAFCERF
jgi:hypothetical protein